MKNPNKAYWLGRKRSEATKEKIRDKLSGHKLSDKTKEKMSVSKTGDKHPGWKGGISKDKEYVSWRKNKRNRVIKRLKQEGKSHSYKDWLKLKEKYKNKCVSCQKVGAEVGLTIDHIIPLSRGGTDEIDNIQPLCFSCNVKKFTKIINYLKICQ